MAFDFSIAATATSLKDFNGLTMEDMVVEGKRLGKSDWVLTTYAACCDLDGRFMFLKFKNAFIFDILGFKPVKKTKKTAADMIAELRAELGAADPAVIKADAQIAKIFGKK